ncbi:hypothetical protein TNCV_2507171 [Trichonephila clavipes]|nr:hypothetical protein TNCV_2507171 [Trichonephila clavipes]
MNWIAHTIRMPDDNVVKKMLKFKVNGIRKHRGPRLRWTDSVESDFGIKNEKTWRTKVNDRSLWRKLQGKATRGCLAGNDDDLYYNSTTKPLNDRHISLLLSSELAIFLKFTFFKFY